MKTVFTAAITNHMTFPMKTTYLMYKLEVHTEITGDRLSNKVKCKYIQGVE